MSHNYKRKNMCRLRAQSISFPRLITLAAFASTFESQAYRLVFVGLAVRCVRLVALKDARMQHIFGDVDVQDMCANWTARRRSHICARLR